MNLLKQSVRDPWGKQSGEGEGERKPGALNEPPGTSGIPSAKSLPFSHRWSNAARSLESNSECSAIYGLCEAGAVDALSDFSPFANLKWKRDCQKKPHLSGQKKETALGLILVMKRWNTELRLLGQTYLWMGVLVVTPQTSTHRRNVWIRVRSQLPGRDNRVGRLRSGRPLRSQLRVRHLHHSGPHQQSCGPPQVRKSPRSHTASTFLQRMLVQI